MLRGFNKRLKALETPERTVYTLGPAAGDYDIEWADAENAVNGTGDAARIVLVNGVAFLHGRINFTGANGALNVPLPDKLTPFQNLEIVVHCYDDSAGGMVPGEVNVQADGNLYIAIAGEGPPFTNNDSVWLSGSYLVAE